MKVQLSDTPIIIEKWHRFYEESTLIEEEAPENPGSTEPNQKNCEGRRGRSEVLGEEKQGEMNLKNERVDE